MTFNIRPAVRENTPLIIGIAGPSKSGKTYSAHRVARGLANGGLVVMLNAEGARGHQYADTFKYHACDIEAPYSYDRYDQALVEIAKLKPACVIVDSISHAHDGPGGMIEQHDKEVERRAGDDYKKRERVTWAAWIKPKDAEGKFIYRMLSMACPIILCFRAKEKMKIVPGKEPIDLGYQPIASERIAFETIFQLMLPPRSKGVPDLDLSEMREPFDTMIKPGKPLDERLGQALAAWAAGSTASAPQERSHEPPNASLGGTSSTPPSPAAAGARITPNQALDLEVLCKDAGVPVSAFLRKAGISTLDELPAEDYLDAVSALKHRAAERGGEARA